MSYVEHPVTSALVACTWERVAGSGADMAATPGHVVVPDACVDVIWSRGRRVIAGPDTGPRLVTPPLGVRVVGARLRPGAAGAALGLPASELRDLLVDAADVLGRDPAASLVELLSVGSDPHTGLSRWLRSRRPPDPLVQAAVSALARPHARVAAVASELGLSARQLQRVVGDAVGYGPKTLARVLRFRRLQTLTPAPLVELALEAGYADQAHMTTEVTRLAGVPPVRFLQDRPLAAA